MKSGLISDFYSQYTSRLIGYICTGIPLLIIAFLYAAYTSGSIASFYVPITDELHVSPVWIILQFLVVGLVAPEQFDGDRFVILGRVSTKDQLNNTDFDDRLQPIRDHVVGERDGRVVKEFTGSESGATMERENLSEILDMAEEDLFDVLAVRDLDRLSRASPWDTIDYLLDLRDAGVILYEHPERYFDWNDLQDFQMLSMAMFFSREWYQRISEGRREKIFTDLTKGKWPMQTHFGYETDDDRDEGERNVYLDFSKGEILYRIFDIYENTHNIAKTQREINERFEDELDEKLTYSRIRTVLTSEFCIGQLSYEGVVKHELDDLAAVSEDKFQNVQSILERSSRDDADKIPKPIVEATSTFGIEYIQSILEQISFRRCKRCGGRLDPYSTTEILGIPVEKVRCESCGYDGKLLSEKEFMEIHQTAPMSCPFCYRTGEFEVRESPLGLDMTRYECRNCSHLFHSSVGPGKFKRYLNNPDLGIELGEDTDPEQDQHSRSSSTQTHQEQLKLTEM